MKKFCPLIKDVCRDTECAFYSFYRGYCSIFSLFYINKELEEIKEILKRK